MSIARWTWRHCHRRLAPWLPPLPLAVPAHLHTPSPVRSNRWRLPARCRSGGSDCRLNAERGSGCRRSFAAGTGWRSAAPASPPGRPSSAGSPPSPLASGLEPVAPPGSICRRARPNRTFRLRQNWMTAPENVCGRPGQRLAGASHSISRSSQTSSKPRQRSNAVYSDQFVVRYRTGTGLLMRPQTESQGPHANPHTQKSHNDATYRDKFRLFRMRWERSGARTGNPYFVMLSFVLRAKLWE